MPDGLPDSTPARARTPPRTPPAALVCNSMGGAMPPTASDCTTAPAPRAHGTDDSARSELSQQHDGRAKNEAATREKEDRN